MTRLHNANKRGSISKVTITHPFHPDRGKSYDYLCRINHRYGEHIECSDESGKIRTLPISITDLYMPDINENSNNIISVDDLLKLKEIVDSILNTRQM